jgi:hypothetical protein
VPAIFISCLGLAGLASFTIEKRIREITFEGSRRVSTACINADINGVFEASID